MWPWSYDTCSASADNQKISACTADPGYGLNSFQGRGSSEIDLLEVMPGHWAYAYDSLTLNYTEPYLSTSFQVAPGFPSGPSRPINGEPLTSSTKWYEGLGYGEHFQSEINSNYYGTLCGEPYVGGLSSEYMQDCISVDTTINASYWDSPHLYRLEWQPDNDGYLEWYLDGLLVFSIPQSALTNGTGALVPREPMYLVTNIAMSTIWGFPGACSSDPSCQACMDQCYDCRNPDCQCAIPDGMKSCSIFPAEMHIDYIRVYQDVNDSSHTIGCSPEGFPTAEYILLNNASYLPWTPSLPPPYSTYIIHIIVYFFWDYLLPLGLLVLLIIVAAKLMEYTTYCRNRESHIDYDPIPNRNL